MTLLDLVSKDKVCGCPIAVSEITDHIALLLFSGGTDSATSAFATISRVPVQVVKLCQRCGVQESRVGVLSEKSAWVPSEQSAVCVSKSEVRRWYLQCVSPASP
jgi:hypothetical protein